MNQSEEQKNINSNFNIIVVDDDKGIVDSLSIFLRRAGYNFTGFTNPLDAIERVKKEHFDLMLLDFIMTPIHGDQVIEEIRKFNKELYILLLTGHNDYAPPLETIRKYDIQGYWEKSDKFNQLLLLIESGIKSISQMRTIININNELQNSYRESIESLRRIVDAKDPYTRGHSDRVSEYSVLIGKKLGLKDSDLETLRIGGLFHDIGKVGVPDSILLKQGKLTDEEYKEIQNHPSIGAHILSSVKTFADLIPIVKHHHERFDGLGYPDNLSGEEIPYFARIAAVADTFDAMTSKRPYRNALPIDVVINEFKKYSGIQFDPNIATTFINLLENDYNTVQKIQNSHYE